MLAGQVHGGETKVVAVQQETLAMAVDATDWVRKSSFASFRTMYFILICVTFFAFKKKWEGLISIAKLSTALLNKMSTVCVSLQPT